MILMIPSEEETVSDRPASTVAFQVRLPAKLHQRAKDAAWRRRTSMNKLVAKALAAFLRRPAPPKKGGR